VTPSTAKKLLSLVSTKKNVDALEEYMNERVNAAHLVMEQAIDPKDLYQAQGAIKELKRLKTLRDEVAHSAEDKNG
tara:strand:+ start:678 stop:905 length:228 start_codon:yes stop_codon:yes gene_type:complete